MKLAQLCFYYVGYFDVIFYQFFAHSEYEPKGRQWTSAAECFRTKDNARWICEKNCAAKTGRQDTALRQS